jgi:hypothetical protein
MSLLVVGWCIALWKIRNKKWEIRNENKKKQ